MSSCLLHIEGKRHSTKGVNCSWSQKQEVACPLRNASGCIPHYLISLTWECQQPKALAAGWAGTNQTVKAAPNKGAWCPKWFTQFYILLLELAQ